MIIDSHVHLSTFTNEGLAFDAVRERLLSEMDRDGIAAACLMPDSESGSAVADLDTTLSLADGKRLFALGTAHLASLTTAHVDKLEDLAGAGKIVGLKLYPGFEEFYPADPECRPLYDICLRHGIPVVFHAGETLMQLWRERYNDPREIARLAERLPDLDIVIAHFAQPHLEVCRDVIRALPRVHADLSGLAHPTVLQVCGRENILEILAETANYRPDALLFGTDWPICDVQAHVEMVNELAVSDEVKEGVFAANAAKLFRLNVNRSS
jgi:predicted TIM-barrel fold metal-dependent hydrolase